MINNYYTFQFLVSTLNSTIAGRRFGEAYTQRPDELVVEFQDEPRRLLFICRPESSVFFLREGINRARRNSASLLRSLGGARLESASIHPSDRLITLRIEDGRSLAAMLYGAGANVLLLDERGTIVDAFKNRRKLEGTAFQRPPILPAYEPAAFRAACAAGGRQTLGSVLRRSCPTLGGTLVRESLERAGIDGSTIASLADERVIAAASAGVRSVLTDLEAPHPMIYRGPGGEAAFFSLIPLHIAAGLTEELYDDVHAALRLCVAGRDAAVRHEAEEETVIAPLRNRLARARRTLEALEKDRADSARAFQYERFGTALMQALATLRKGQRRFDAVIDGATLAVPLEPSLSPLENAQRYFRKAKRAKTAEEKASRRMEDMRARIASAAQLLSEAERAHAEGGTEKFLRAHAAALKEFGLGPGSRPAPDVPFRVFTVEGGFEVWAGKNSANNDLLTLRHARPHDLWFHARGGSGSHVVLRTGTGRGEPGKRAREQAAAIAAYYSAMKTAGTVAVAMTEKRYVRKPRGAPAGTVVLEREKVLFVKPQLPASGA